jgi:hypothetical protein
VVIYLDEIFIKNPELSGFFVETIWVLIDMKIDKK